MRKVTTAKPRDTKYVINVIVTLALIFLFQFIPAPAPITKSGMALLGAFLGLIYGVVTVDMIWPAFASILLFGIYAKDVYPSSVTDTGIEQAIVNSVGQWIFTFLLMVLFITRVLEQTGVLRRMTLWLVTRPFAKKGPWRFTLMLLFAGLLVAYVLDGTPTVLLMTLICREIIIALGFKEGDDWPKMVLDGVSILTCVGFACSPVGHNLTIAILGIVSGATGIPINIATYLIGAFPIAALLFFGMFFYFKLIVKPDMSRFEAIDYNIIENLRPGKMGKKEKIVTVISLIVLVWWVVPGFFSLLAPDARITALLAEAGLLWPSFLAVIAMAIIRVDGEPILKIAPAAKEIDWTVPLMFSGMIMISLAFMQDTTGFPAWLEQGVVPLVSGTSPYVTILVIAVLNILLTNVLNNWAVGIVFATAGAAIAASAGINPAIVAVTIALGCNLAFTTPAACPTYAFACADPYCGSAYVLKHGIAMTVIACIILGALGYPLFALVFGA